MEDLLFQLKVTLNENDIFKGWFTLGMGTLLSIPAAFVGEGFKRLSMKMPWALEPAKIPILMLFVGGMLGWWVAYQMTLPVSIGIEIGGLAGGGSGVAYKHRNVVNGMFKKGGNPK